MTKKLKKYQLILDGEFNFFIDTFYIKEFRNELIELLDVNNVLSYETLIYLDIDTLMIITQIEMTCEIKIKEVL